MAATTYVTVTNLTATTITVSGDEGKHSITIGHTPGANSAVVHLKDLIGDYLLCSTLADWITAGKVSITRGSLTLPAADLDAYAQGSDMNRADYDADDDGIVDSAETVNFASVTAETALAVGDSFLIYDLSATAARKMTVPNALNISVLSAATSAADDSALIYDTTASAVRKTTVEDLLNPLKLTAAAAVASGDIIAIHDLTAPTIASSTTVEQLLNPVNLTAAAAVASGDIVILHDLTAPTIASSTTVEQLLNPVNLTAAAAVASGDIIAIHDLTAPTIASSTTVEQLLNPVNLTAAAAVAEDDIVIIHDLTAPTIASSTTVASLVNPNNLTAETVSDDADSIIIYDNSAAAVRKMTRANFLNPAIVHESHLQAAAATSTDTLFIAGASGVIIRALAMAGTAAAAGESMTLDVQIGGATCLTGVITIDDSSGTAVVAGTVDGTADDLVAGDVVTIVRTYVAGGGPTMANTHISVWFSQSL